MHVSLSIIKADIASIGGHICPSQCLVQTVREFITEHGAKLLLDSYVSYTGDDIAIVSTHERRPTNEAVHKLCWDVFIAGTEAAKVQGIHGAGQDLIKDSFSGNVRGMVPAGADSPFPLIE
jgi:fructose 1,6-bisphosphate aldolase/phosphatase